MVHEVQHEQGARSSTRSAPRLGAEEHVEAGRVTVFSAFDRGAHGRGTLPKAPGRGPKAPSQRATPPPSAGSRARTTRPRRPRDGPARPRSARPPGRRRARALADEGRRASAPPSRAREHAAGRRADEVRRGVEDGSTGARAPAARPPPGPRPAAGAAIEFRPRRTARPRRGGDEARVHELGRGRVRGGRLAERRDSRAVRSTPQPRGEPRVRRRRVEERGAPSAPTSATASGAPAPEQAAPPRRAPAQRSQILRRARRDRPAHGRQRRRHVEAASGHDGTRGGRSTSAPSQPPPAPARGSLRPAPCVDDAPRVLREAPA